MIPPLPIRVEPSMGEAWHGYLRRTAHALGVQQPMELLAPFLPVMRGAQRAFRMRRSLGIAAQPETYKRLANHFHLDDHEIRAMFLERFKTISCRWDATDRERLDPLNRSEESIVWAPAVRSHKALTHCPSCRSEDPLHWSLTWLTTCQAICPHHGEWLTPAVDWRPRQAFPEETAIQVKILTILDGDGDKIPWTEPETFISDLLIMATAWTGRQDTIDSLIPAGRHLLSRPGTAIPDAVRQPIERRVAQNRTTHDLNFAWGDPLRSRVILDLTRLPDPPHYAVLVRYREPPIEPVAGLSSNPSHHPELLPLDLYLPDLALLCGDIPLNRGRILCAAAVWQLGVGAPWGHGPIRTTPMRPLAHLQATLEQAGRLERFWDHVTEAAHLVTAAAIDYPARRQAITTVTIDEIAAAAPDVGRPVIELWLHLHWACRRPSGRPETEDLADVHASNGALLTEITSQMQEAQ